MSPSQYNRIVCLFVVSILLAFDALDRSFFSFCIINAYAAVFSKLCFLVLNKIRNDGSNCLFVFCLDLKHESISGLKKNIFQF